MATRCIRGAITVEVDDREAVLAGTEQMLREIIKQNDIKIEDISSIIFTVTDDILSLIHI